MQGSTIESCFVNNHLSYANPKITLISSKRKLR